MRCALGVWWRETKRERFTEPRLLASGVPIQDPPQQPTRTTATAGDTEPDAQGPQQENEDLPSRQRAMEHRCSAVGHQVCSGGQGAPLS